MAVKKNNKNMNIIQVIKNYWNGKYSLAASFWYGFIIFGGIMSIPAFILTDAYIDSLGNLGLMVFIIYYLVFYPYIILAYVGTWRSATNFKPKKDQWSWGTITKVYIVLNGIRAVVEIIKEFSNI